LFLFFLSQTMCLQPMHMTSLSSSPVLYSPHTTYDFSPASSHMCQLALSRSEPSHSFPVSYWFTLVLWRSHWELMGWLPYSLLFLYNPSFLQATCSTCCLLLAWLTLQFWRWRCFFQNTGYLSTDFMALHPRWHNYS
jgi:hypothetical protein